MAIHDTQSDPTGELAGRPRLEMRLWQLQYGVEAFLRVLFQTQADVTRRGSCRSSQSGKGHCDPKVSVYILFFLFIHIVLST